MTTRPTFAELLAYARKAVKSEHESPLHGRLAGYDNQAVLVDIANHFPTLDTDDEETAAEIREAARNAEQLEYPDEEL